MRQTRKPPKAQAAATDGPPPPPARRNRAAAVADDALNEGAGAFGRAGFTDPGLVLRWSTIAGAEVARVAQPVKLQEAPDGATLTLRCRPGAAVLLQHETRALIARINAYVGAGRIARLRLLTGDAADIPPPSRHPGAGSMRDPEPEPPRTLDQALARLAERRNPRHPRGH